MTTRLNTAIGNKLVRPLCWYLCWTHAVRTQQLWAPIDCPRGS